MKIIRSVAKQHGNKYKVSPQDLSKAVAIPKETSNIVKSRIASPKLLSLADSFSKLKYGKPVEENMFDMARNSAIVDSVLTKGF